MPKLALPACVLTGLALGLLWYWSMPSQELHPFDKRFYFNLYLGIGAVAGFVSWYLAKLVEKDSIRARSAVLVLFFPLMITFILTFGKNPAVAVVVAVLFPLLTLPTYIIVRNKPTSAEK